jgi:hypothetical protein
MSSVAANTIMDRAFSSCLPSDADLERYIFPVTDRAPSHLRSLCDEESSDAFRHSLLTLIREHRVQRSVLEFERLFCQQRPTPATLATILKTVRHYHNGLRGGLLHVAARITEDTRLHRGHRDRIGAAGPLFAAFDEFTDNPAYTISIVEPALRAVLDEGHSTLSMAEALTLLRQKNLLRRDEPHLERFYGVVDELHRSGHLTATSEEFDQENPLEGLPAKAVNAYQARRILTARPDVSYGTACAFLYGNESVAGLFYGKLYKGFRKFQAEYGLSDHGCDYFGDHASEDGKDGAPAFEASHASLMLQAVLMYAALGRHSREQILLGLHLFLETYASLVDSLCEIMSPQKALGAKPTELHA